MKTYISHWVSPFQFFVLCVAFYQNVCILFTAIDVIEYAKCRAAELQLLDAATQKRKVSQAVNGLMSISMRRRAMSHNVKRMPRRIREVTNSLIIDRVVCEGAFYFLGDSIFGGWMETNLFIKGCLKKFDANLQNFQTSNPPISKLYPLL